MCDENGLFSNPENEEDEKKRWSRAAEVRHPDNIQLDNPFYGKPPFRPKYDQEPRPKMQNLLNFEYYRMWKKEHLAYLKKRTEKKVHKKDFVTFNTTPDALKVFRERLLGKDFQTPDCHRKKPDDAKPKTNNQEDTGKFPITSACTFCKSRYT